MTKENLTLVQAAAASEYSKDGGIKRYPSLELVRIEKKLFSREGKPKVLEYAFGSGCNTEFLVSEGYNVYGLDVSKSALNTTQNRFKANNKLSTENLHLSLISTESKKLDFDDNYFDFIVAMSILSLLGSEERIRLLLNEFKRVLKKGGKIVLDINDHESEFSKGKKEIKKNVFLGGPYGDNINCYCLNSEESFCKLIKDYFTIKDSGYSCHKLFNRRINEWIVCGEKG